jgi:hypothetical protein
MDCPQLVCGPLETHALSVTTGPAGSVWPSEIAEDGSQRSMVDANRESDARRVEGQDRGMVSFTS